MSKICTFCIPFCIIASLFYFCFTWNNEEATIKKPTVVMWMVKKNSKQLNIFVQEVPKVIYKYFAKAFSMQLEIIKWDQPKLVQITLNFQTNIKCPKNSKENMVGFLMLFWASMNIFINFGNVLMPQLIRKGPLFQLKIENRKEEKGSGGFSRKMPSSSSL